MDKVYLPGKGAPEKTVYIDNPDPSGRKLSVNALQPVPYRLFEPALGQPLFVRYPSPE